MQVMFYCLLTISACFVDACMEDPTMKKMRVYTGRFSPVLENKMHTAVAGQTLVG